MKRLHTLYIFLTVYESDDDEKQESDAIMICTHFQNSIIAAWRM